MPDSPLEDLRSKANAAYSKKNWQDAVALFGQAIMKERSRLVRASSERRFGQAIDEASPQMIALSSFRPKVQLASATKTLKNQLNELRAMKRRKRDRRLPYTCPGSASIYSFAHFCRPRLSHSTEGRILAIYIPLYFQPSSDLPAWRVVVG
ncbi:hypothetical protein JCM10296v2_001371 [Rhodotorula toruloides]